MFIIEQYIVLLLFINVLGMILKLVQIDAKFFLGIFYGIKIAMFTSLLAGEKTNQIHIYYHKMNEGTL